MRCWFATFVALQVTALFSSAHAAAKLAAAKLAPIVFVPGLGGSVLEAKLGNRSKHRDCAKNADWYTLWFSELQVLTRVSCSLLGAAIIASRRNRKGTQFRPVQP